MEVSKLPSLTAAKHIVPKNAFRKLNLNLEKTLYAVPSAKNIIHPFYKPSKIEELIACFTEGIPKLLDGKSIVPTIIEDSRSLKPTLMDSKLEFQSVNGICSWLHEYSELKSDSSVNYVPMKKEDINDSISVVNIKLEDHKNGRDIGELFEEYAQNNLDENYFNNIIRSGTLTQNSKLFLEDVYCFLLQNYVNSNHHITLIINSIKNHLNDEIVNLNIVQKLITQILVTIKQNNIRVNEKLNESVSDLFLQMNSSFNIDSGELNFLPLVKQSLLEFYICGKSLYSSKRLIDSLYASNNFPNEDIVVLYLQLVQEKLNENISQDVSMRSFAYTSNFCQCIHNTSNSTILEFFITNSRHYQEISYILNLISKQKNELNILDTINANLIKKVGSLSNNRMVNSINLSSLYQRCSKAHKNILPKEYTMSFIKELSIQRNILFISQLIENEKIDMTKDILVMIIDNLNLKNGTTSNDFKEYHITSNLQKLQFFTKYIQPYYNSLSITMKSNVLKSFSSFPVIIKMLENETVLVREGEDNMFSIIIQHCFKHKFLTVRDIHKKEASIEEIILALKQKGYNMHM